MTEVSIFLDKLIDGSLPQAMTRLSALHWTPAHIAQRVSRFLAAEGEPNILDIGSGIGKFCLAAAYYMPNAHFVGVEQRQDLVEIADKAKHSLGLTNVTFIHANFIQLDLSRFDHFYFYNSFYENISEDEKIDENIDYSRQLYDYYSSYLRFRFSEMPRHTKLCTFSGWNDEVPSSFCEIEMEESYFLKYWIKK
jgi:SAM-dependent methyltransferase